MEIIFIILVAIGIIVIFGKAILVLLGAMGGILALIIPIAIICAVIYFITLLF